MWDSPLGERILTGAEAEFFKDMLGLEVSMLAEHDEHDDECVPTGMPLVDDLSYGPRLGLRRGGGVALRGRAGAEAVRVLGGGRCRGL